MISDKMEARIRVLTCGGFDDRVSLSVDNFNTYILSMTHSGVRLFYSGEGVATGDNDKPKVFRGNCQDFDDLPVVSSVVYNGIKVDCESDGGVAQIVAYDSHGCKSWLLKVTREGIYRYRFINLVLLDTLDWPYDSERRLQILR